MTETTLQIAITAILLPPPALLTEGVAPEKFTKFVSATELASSLHELINDVDIVAFLADGGAINFYVQRLEEVKELPN